MGDQNKYHYLKMLKSHTFFNLIGLFQLTCKTIYKKCIPAALVVSFLNKE